MKIYTKTGDDGSTGLNGGKRVPKSDLRVSVYGTIDELNSLLGIAVAFDVPEPIKESLVKLNSILFIAGSDIATPMNNKINIERINTENILWLENLIDEYTSQLPELRHFILPGGSQQSAFLHLARTVCRRAERIAVELSQSEELGEFIIKFLNRLSDYLFTASRYANQLAGKADIEWIPIKK
jgi:cob(I)alamin adenosyltransferase